jgi:hypothetical protein
VPRYTSHLLVSSKVTALAMERGPGPASGISDRRGALSCSIEDESQGNNGMFNVDLPADGREPNAAKCGYGISLVGDEMRMVKGSFIVT